MTGRLLSLVLGALCVALCGCQSAAAPRNGAAGPVHPTTPSAASTAVSGLRRVHSPGAVDDDMHLVRGQCHASGSTAATVRPDPACTPGAIDPAVTQATIATTICKPGWTATVRPPVTATEPWKRKLMADYGLTGSLRGYELDHLIPLEFAGANSTSNLWPELGATPNPKDAVENRLHREVCAGRLPLAVAQQEIAANWTTAR